MTQEEFKELKEQLKKLIAIFSGNGEKGVCERVRDNAGEIKRLQEHCRRQHESKIRKWGPLAMQFVMMVIAILAIFIKIK